MPDEPRETTDARGLVVRAEYIGPALPSSSEIEQSAPPMPTDQSYYYDIGGIVDLIVEEKDAINELFNEAYKEDLRDSGKEPRLFKDAELEQKRLRIKLPDNTLFSVSVQSLSNYVGYMYVSTMRYLISRRDTGRDIGEDRKEYVGWNNRTSEVEIGMLDGSINLLDTLLRLTFPGFEDYIIENMRNIIRLRNKLRSHTRTRFTYVTLYGNLGVTGYPRINYPEAWKQILHRYLESLQGLTDLYSSL